MVIHYFIEVLIHSSGVSTATHTVSILHEFNTGEQLIYKPQTGQSAIGIAIFNLPVLGLLIYYHPQYLQLKKIMI